MGLFDMFGAGGGKLSIEPQALTVQPGQTLQGKIAFTAGKRAQQITHVKARLTQTLQQMEMTQQGPQPRSHSQNVCPEATVAGAFTAEPGNRYEFAFAFQIPAGIPSSAPNLCSYRLSASADIDGEVDPGSGVEIQVTGGAMPAMAGQPMMGGMPGQPMMGGMPGQPMMGGMPGQPMQGMPGQPMMGGMPGQPMQGMPGQPMMAGVAAAMGAAMGAMAGQPMPGQPMPGQPMPGQPMMGGMPPQAPMAPQPLGVGSTVMAQWQDGRWFPARVLQMQNGMFAVDWVDPNLGQSTWVGPHQVQPMPAGQPGYPAQPMPGQPMPGQPMMSGGQPMAKQPDPGYAKQGGYDKGGYPDKGGYVDKSQAGQVGIGPGSAVLAPWHDGQMHPGRVVQVQGNMICVDWENPQLGASAWVDANRIKPR